MKKLFVIIALMIGSSQVFAQENAKAQKVKTKSNHANDKTSNENDAENQKCPDYLDCSSGAIKYFEYKKDYEIEAPEVCEPLGLEKLIIAKGIYEVIRKSPNEGGMITITARGQVRGKIKTGLPYKVLGTNPKGKDCEGFGNTCWFVNNNENKEEKFPIVITPIFEKDVLIAIQLQYPTSGKGTMPPRMAGF